MSNTKEFNKGGIIAVNPEMLPGNEAYVEPRAAAPALSAADQATFAAAVADQKVRDNKAKTTRGLGYQPL